MTRQESFLSSLVTAGVWKSLDRISGLLKHAVIAASIGLSMQLDVFYMVIAILGVFVCSWGNMIDVIAVPQLVRYWQDGEKEKFRSLSGSFLTLSVFGSALLALILIITWPWIINIAMGFESDRRMLLKNALPWLMPFVLFFIPLRMLGAIARSIRQFSLFYEAEFLTALVVLLCVVLSDDPHVLLWSLSLGTTIAFVYLALKTRTYTALERKPFSPDLNRSMAIAPSLLVLQGGHYIYTLTDRIFVSFLPQGAVGALSYGMTLVALIPGMLSMGGSFITVIAEQNSQQNRARRLNEAISLSIFLAVSAYFLLYFYGDLFISLLLERGVFDRASTETVYHAVTAFSWMTLPLFLIGPLDQIFQVENKLGFMVRRTLLGIFVNGVLNAWFLFGLGWGLQGIAFATSISYWVMLLSGLMGVNSLGIPVEFSRHAKWLLWLVGFSMPLAALATLKESIALGTLPTLSVAVIATVLLAVTGGLTYPGQERALVVTTLNRLLRRG